MKKSILTQSALRLIGDYGAWSGIHSKFRAQKKHKEFVDFLKEYYHPPKKRISRLKKTDTTYKVTKNKMGKTEIRHGGLLVGVQG